VDRLCVTFSEINENNGKNPFKLALIFFMMIEILPCKRNFFHHIFVTVIVSMDFISLSTKKENQSCPKCFKMAVIGLDDQQIVLLCILLEPESEELAEIQTDLLSLGLANPRQAVDPCSLSACHFRWPACACL